MSWSTYRCDNFAVWAEKFGVEYRACKDSPQVCERKKELYLEAQKTYVSFCHSKEPVEIF